MGFHFRAEISHELFGKILMENQDKIIGGEPRDTARFNYRGLNVQLSDLSDQDVLEIAAECGANVEKSVLPYSYMTLSAIRPDARDASLDADIAGIWGGK